jgi:alpha-mannosidase
MITSQRTLDKVTRMVPTYESLMFAPIRTIPQERLDTKEHLYAVPDDSQPWAPAEPGAPWGEAWSNTWFRGTVTLDAEEAEKNLYIRSGLGGRETLFYVDGQERGIFSQSLETGARGNHHTLLFHHAGQPAGTHQLTFECYAGHPCIGTMPMDPREKDADSPSNFSFRVGPVTLMERRDDVKDFVFDLQTLTQMAQVLPEKSTRRGSIVRCLAEVFAAVFQCPEEHPEEVWREALAKGREIMAPTLACTNGSSAPFIGLTGHSHMDTAWLWTSKETIRKNARTFSNALNLMEQYPEYRFIQSSPIHAEMVLNHYPDLFKRVAEKVAEGRWEPNGGMYVEADGNMPAGESFIRQFLYGQAFTQKHFDYRADTFWLPDTFGYSAALPQIMRGCGIKYFLTTKLSWNDTNTFPYDTFTWKGIDGSDVLVHFNRQGGAPDAGSLYKGVEDGRLLHTDISDKRLCSYGKGDGGGGPTFEEIELARRVRDLQGCPRSEHMSVSDFMGLLEQDQELYPVYNGELYVELHRGVLTVVAPIKKLNRRAESTLRDLELMDVLGSTAGLNRFDPDKLLSLWKVLLKNQFHDILPGTSIPEEHDEAIRALTELVEESTSAFRKRLGQVQKDSPAVTLLNPFSWEICQDVQVGALPKGHTLASEVNASQTIETIDGQIKTVVEGITRHALGLVSVPVVPCSSESASPFAMEGETLTTPFYKVRFSSEGYLDSLIDQRTGRELRGTGLPLNTFLMGEDLPKIYDNWDIDADQHLKMAPVKDRLSRSITDGPLQFRIRQTYRIGQHSVLMQDMVFHKNSARIDFETRVDWKEKHSLLKAGFDLNVRSMNMKSDIQFGWIERPTHRNTSFDAAKFEVCQHKWSDLSETGYGIAILNDGKYGIGVHQSDMRISLLKSGGHPDPRGGEGVHTFSYALLPHVGGFSAETVIREAHQFNHGDTTQTGALKQEVPSLVTVDQPNVLVESVKQAEDGNGIILRVFEAEGTGVNTTLDFGRTIQSVEATNMLEDPGDILLQSGQALDLTFSAFEIKTLRVLG